VSTGSDRVVSGKQEIPDLPARGDGELVEDVAQMRFDGTGTQQLLGTNLAVGGTRGDQPGDVQLLGGERVGGLNEALTEDTTRDAFASRQRRHHRGRVTRHLSREH
jgi:hypothetical protein